MPCYTVEEGTIVVTSIAMGVTPIVGCLSKATLTDTTTLVATTDIADPVISNADHDVNHTVAVRGCCKGFSDRLGQWLCFEFY